MFIKSETLNTIAEVLVAKTPDTNITAQHKIVIDCRCRFKSFPPFIRYILENEKYVYPRQIKIKSYH